MRNKIIIKHRLILIINLFLLNSLHCQVFNHISVEQGLPSPNVYNIIQDKQGYLWAATYNGGLSRYDGKEFVAINSDKNNWVYQTRIIKEEEDGSFLVGASTGIYKLNNNLYSKIKLDTLNYQVTDFLRISPNHLYIATSTCLIELIDSNATYYGSPPYNVNSIITTLIKCKNNIYIGKKNGLWKLNILTKKYDKVFLNENEEFSVRKGICVNDTLILATNKGIVYIKNDRIIKKINKTNSNLLDDDISYVYKSKYTNEVWVGGNGVLYRLISENKFQIFNSSNGLENFYITCILEDNERNIIISTRRNGIYVLIRNLCKNYSDKDNLIDKKIIGVTNLNDTILLILSPSYLYSLNKISNKISILLNQNTIENSEFTSLTTLNDENIYFSTENNKVYLFNIKNKLKKEINTKTNFDRINNLFTDSKKRLFISTINGCYVYDNNMFSGILRQYQTSQFMVNIFEMKNSSIYLFGGNTIFKIQENDTISINTKFDKYRAISGEKYFTNSMTEDVIHNLWFNTSTDLMHYNTETKKITSIQKYLDFNTSGFGTVHSFQNYLVATSENGIYVLNIKDFYNNKKIRYQHYTKNDGMISSNIISSTNYIDKSGYIWCGTNEGLLKFNLLNKSNTTFNPKIILNDIELFYEKINWSKIGFSTRYNIPLNLKLSHKQNNLTFKFVAIHYSNPNKVLYDIQLKNSKKELSFENSTGEINFTNLHPDTYTLQIRPKLGKDILADNSFTYQFEILTPFYKKNWFYVLVVVVIVLLIYIYIKIREKQIVQKNIALEKIVSERTELLAEVNNELLLKSDYLEKNNLELNFKNLQIKDSLEYSENLQKTILNLNNNFNSTLNKISNFNLLYKPKDNVSGDFYSIFKSNDKTFIIVADCTGHGVPGASGCEKTRFLFLK